jgi:hypothetical protein
MVELPITGPVRKMISARRQEFLTAFVTLGLLAILIWGVVSLLLAIFSGLDPNVASASIAGLTGVILLVVGQYFNRSREIREAHRDKKVRMYGGFMEMLGNAMRSTKENSDYRMEDDPEAVTRLFELNRDAILWSSPPVIKALLDLKIPVGESPASIMLRMDDLLKAIRKDLGLSNWGLPRGQLVKMFLRNPAELDDLL